MKYLLLFFVCLCFSARADWYVATNGNNAAAGTLGAPWKDIRYGVINMTAGETLFIRGGTYGSDGFQLEEFKSGPATNQPTIIQSYPGESVTFYPSNFAHGMLIRSSNIFLNGFEIFGTNCSSTGIKLTAGAFNVTITNVTVRGVPAPLGQGIHTMGENEGDPMNSLITHCRFITNGWPAASDFYTNNPGLHQTYIQSSGMTMEHCYFEGATNSRGQTAGIQYFGGDCTNGVFRNNFFTNCNHGIEAAASRGSNCWIYNNIMVGNLGNAIKIHQMSFVYVQNNTGHGNGAGIFVTLSTNVWVENNINEGSPVASDAGIYLDRSSNVVVTHNLGATNRVDFSLFKTPAVTTNNNLFQKVRYIDDAGEGETFTNGTVYVTKFASTATSDLHVLSGSDAIGRGKTESVFNIDFGGNVRTLPWTIGAWQFLPANSVNIITARIGTGIILGP